MNSNKEISSVFSADSFMDAGSNVQEDKDEVFEKREQKDVKVTDAPDLAGRVGSAYQRQQDVPLWFKEIKDRAIEEEKKYMKS